MKPIVWIAAALTMALSACSAADLDAVYQATHPQRSAQYASVPFVPTEAVYDIVECAGLTGQMPSRAMDRFDPIIRELCIKPTIVASLGS